MPALYASGTWIDVQKPEGLVIFHLEDMGVTGNEKLRRTGKERRTDRRVVIARITADVLDEHVDILTFETVQFAVHEPQIASVTIATDSTEGTKGRQALSHLYRADIAGMPYLITGFEVVQILLVPITVGVADNAYFLHCSER